MAPTSIRDYGHKDCHRGGYRSGDSIWEQRRTERPPFSWKASNEWLVCSVVRNGETCIWIQSRNCDQTDRTRNGPRRYSRACSNGVGKKWCVGGCRPRSYRCGRTRRFPARCPSPGCFILSQAGGKQSSPASSMNKRGWVATGYLRPQTPSTQEALLAS